MQMFSRAWLLTRNAVQNVIHGDDIVFRAVDKQLIVRHALNERAAVHVVFPDVILQIPADSPENLSSPAEDFTMFKLPARMSALFK